MLEKSMLPLKNILQACLLILVSNLLIISNNYLVSWTGLLASEIALVRGGLQVLVFGSLVVKNWRKKFQPGTKGD